MPPKLQFPPFLFFMFFRSVGGVKRRVGLDRNFPVFVGLKLECVIQKEQKKNQQRKFHRKKKESKSNRHKEKMTFKTEHTPEKRKAESGQYSLFFTSPQTRTFYLPIFYFLTFFFFL